MAIRGQAEGQNKREGKRDCGRKGKERGRGGERNFIKMET